MFQDQTSKKSESQDLPLFNSYLSLLKSSQTNSYKSSLDKQYQQLKIKLKSVEEKNKAALKKIKNNMLQHTREEEDIEDTSIDCLHKHQSLSSLQRTILYSDYNENQLSSEITPSEIISSEDQIVMTQFGYPIQKSYTKEIFDCNLLQKHMEEFQGGIRKKISIILHNLWKTQTKFQGISLYVEGIKKKLRIKKQLQNQHGQINKVLKKQRSFLIDDYEKKLAKYSLNNEQLYEKLKNYKIENEEKNCQLNFALKKIEKLQQTNSSLEKLLKESETYNKKTINQLIREQNQQTIQTEKKYNQLFKSYSSSKLIIDQTRQLSQLKIILEKKQSELILFKNKNEIRIEQIKNLTNKIEAKNQQINIISANLKQVMLSEQKTKHLNQELENQLLSLQKSKISKEDETNQKIKKLSSNYKKKINQLNQKHQSIRQFVMESARKIIKGSKKEDFSKNLITSSIIEQLITIFSIIQKKQEEIILFFTQTCDIPPQQIQTQGVHNILSNLSQVLKQKDKKIQELQKLQTEYEDKICKIKRSSSPIFNKNASMKSLHANPIGRKRQQEKIGQSTTKKIIVLESSKEIEIQNDNLRKQIEDRNIKINNLELMQKKMKIRISEVEHENNLIEEQLSQKKQNVDSIIQQRVNQSRKFFEQQLRKLNEKNINLNKEINLLKKSHLEIEAKKNSEITAVENKNYTLKAQHKLLEAALKQKHEQLQQSRNQNILIKQNLQKKQVKINELEIQIEELNSELALNNQPRSIIFQVDNLKESIKEKDQIIKQIQHRNKKLFKQKQEIQSNMKINILQKMGDTKRQIQVQSIKQQLEILKKHQQQAEKKHDFDKNKLTQEISQLKELNKDSQKQILQIRKEKSQQFKKINKLKNQLDSQVQKGINLKAKIKQNQEQISILKHQKQQLIKINQQICKLNEQNNKKILEDSFLHHEQQQKKCRSIEQLQQQSKQMKKLIKQYEYQLENKSKALEQSRKANQQLKNKYIMQLEQKSKNLQEVTQQSSGNIKNLKKTVKVLELQNSENMQIIDECKRHLQSKQSKIVSLKKQLKELNLLLQSKQKEIFTLIQKINMMKYELMDDIDAKSQYIREIKGNYDVKQNIYHEKIELFTIKINNLEKQINEKNNMLNKKSQEVNQMQRQLTQNKLAHQAIIQSNKLLMEQKLQLKREVELAKAQIQQKNKINQEFIQEIQKQHQKQIRMLQKQSKKIELAIKSSNQINLTKQNEIKIKNKEIQSLKAQLQNKQKQYKNAIEKAQQKQQQLFKAAQQIQQLNQALVVTKQSLKHSHCQNNLKPPSNILIGINARQVASSVMPKTTKLALTVPQQQEQMDSIMEKSLHSKSTVNNKKITQDYIKKLRQQINGFLTNKYQSFNKSFIKQHQPQLVAELSGLRNDIMKNKLKNSILDEIEVIDHQDLQFVSRLDDELNEFVYKLQRSTQQDVQEMKSALILYEAKVHQLLQQKERGQKQFSQMNDFYRRQIKCEKTRADKLTDALSTIQKCIGKLIDLLTSKQYKILELKECFEKIDDIYQEFLGASLNDYDKYVEAYVKSKQESKKKKWF